MNDQVISQKELIKIVVSRVIGFFLTFGIIFFLPAGTFSYWQAWVYLVILFIPMLFTMAYLIKNSPDLLERRMRMREKETTQKSIVIISAIFLALAYLLPGFDYRFGWSNIPPVLVIIADLFVVLGYVFIILVFRENRYASRVIEVDQTQTVISSGPYAIVRHPMYLGTIVMYVFSPLALGSYWAIIPALHIIPTLIARIINEEMVLSRDLKGYEEYKQKTKYRLFPGIW
jgi:protein-S-isoprenylcysteine O-methyltransferase Ste14